MALNLVSIRGMAPEETDTSFDELFEKFGRRIAVLTLSLTKTKFVIDTDDDSTLSLTKKRAIPEKQRQKEYAIRIKESDADAKLIKLCDISANLGELKKQTISKTKKRKIGKTKVPDFTFFLSFQTKIFNDFAFQNTFFIFGKYFWFKWFLAT